MLDVRQLWRALHGVPQLLLVQPEQLNYDLAYALATLPLVIAGIVFFLQDAVLLFAISFLAGIVCLLALQLARLTFGLPAWVGFKATHPLVASMLIACYFSPHTPAWIGASMVILFIVIDTVIWPQLRRVMIHPAHRYSWRVTSPRTAGACSFRNDSPLPSASRRVRQP